MSEILNIDMLEQLGLNKIIYNGIIPEYFIPLSEKYDPEIYCDYKIAIRFGEWKNEDFRVWLFSAGSMTFCKDIRTFNQIKQLYFMLKGKQIDNPKE